MPPAQAVLRIAPAWLRQPEEFNAMRRAVVMRRSVRAEFQADGPPVFGHAGAMSISQIAGILPAIVFPVATGFQLFRILRARSAAGVSAVTWVLFGLANVALYVYAEHYTDWQAIVGMLLSAVLDFAIATLAIVGFRTAAAGDQPNATAP